MTYNLCFSVALGAGYATTPSGTKQLQAQLVNSSGGTPDPPVAAGFYNVGGGNYLWNGSIPDGYQGGVAFQIADSSTTPATVTVLAFASINPQDFILNGQLRELSTGAPAANPTLEQALMLLYMALRNQMDTTATGLTFHDSSGTVIAHAALSDTGGTFTRGEMT